MLARLDDAGIGQQIFDLAASAVCPADRLGFHATCARFRARSRASSAARTASTWTRA